MRQIWTASHHDGPNRLGSARAHGGVGPLEDRADQVEREREEGDGGEDALCEVGHNHRNLAARDREVVRDREQEAVQRRRRSLAGRCLD